MNEKQLFVLYDIKSVVMPFIMLNLPLYTRKGQFCFDCVMSGQILLQYNIDR